MLHKIILFILLIIQVGCFKKQSEKDLLNKVDPVGYYGNHPGKGFILNIDELLSSGSERVGGKFLVQGIITEVCPMRGCWLKVKDFNSDSSIRIKVTDGEIVFPLSATGKNIIAEGIFTKLELSKKQAKNWKRHLALEKGIDLDTSSIILTESDFYEYRLNSSSAKIF